MFGVPQGRSGKLLLGALLLWGGIPLWSCVERSGPLQTHQGRQLVILSLADDVSPGQALSQAGPINHIRVTATLGGTGETIGRVEEDVDPTAPSWVVVVQVEIPPVPDPEVVLTVELLSLETAVESVEWSGRGGPIPLIAPGGPSEVSIQVFRGPVENLSATGVSITAPGQIRVGKSAPLQADVDMSPASGNPTVYWSSLTPATGTISDAGVFEAIAEGSAQVQATVGPVSDVESISVLPPLAQVTLIPSQASLSSLGEEVQFQATVLDQRLNVAEGETVTWSVDDEGVLENLGSGAFKSVSGGTAIITATSDSEPTLLASATVEVKQVPVAVVVTPETATLRSQGETAWFTATALDGNGNPIHMAAFAWTSGDDRVSVVDQFGLATATGGGTTEIRAEVVDSGVFGTAVLVVDIPLILALSPEQVTLEALGSTVQLELTATDGAGNPAPDLVFDWASSDPAVATVDQSGLVTAVADGATTVSVATSGVVATVAVTVQQKVVALRWVQQPQDGVEEVPLDPPPTVEALDSRGHRVVGFEGAVSVADEYLGYEYEGSPGRSRTASPTLPPPEGSSLALPQLSVLGVTSVNAVQGLATFTNLYWRLDDAGPYQLEASTTIDGVKLSIWSAEFRVRPPG